MLFCVTYCLAVNCMHAGCSPMASSSANRSSGSHRLSDLRPSASHTILYDVYSTPNRLNAQPRPYPAQLVDCAVRQRLGYSEYVRMPYADDSEDSTISAKSRSPFASKFTKSSLPLGSQVGYIPNVFFRPRRLFVQYCVLRLSNRLQ